MINTLEHFFAQNLECDEKKDLLTALQTLLDLDTDHAKNPNAQGFNKVHGPFARSLYEQAIKKGLSESQWLALRRMLVYYTGQLSSYHLTIPSEEQVKHSLEKTRPTNYITPKPASKVPILDIVNDELIITMPYALKEKFDTFRELWVQKSKKPENKIHGYINWFPNEKVYKVECTSPEAITLFTLPEWFPEATLSASVVKIKRELEKKLAEQLRVKQEEDEAKKEEYFKILETLGDLNVPYNGITLYKHQRQGIHFAVWCRRCIIADQRGLGKTYQALIAAKAFHLYYGWDVKIITKKSIRQDWARSAQKVNIPVEIYTWETIPVIMPHWKNFVLIADEAHNAKNFKAMRTKQLIGLSLDEKCQAFFALTGTPTPNNRPAETLPLLYMCKHPKVYHPLKEKWYVKKREYEKLYCVPITRVLPDGRQITETKGASNLFLWNSLYIYDYKRGKQNDAHACIIARKKDEIKDSLPPLTRILEPIEVNEHEARVYAKILRELKEKYENNLKEKLKTFEKKIQENEGREATGLEIEEEEKKIRRAEAMLTYQFMIMAGSFAKIPSAVEKILELHNGGEEKVTVFTNFPEVGKQISDILEEKVGKGTVAYINAGTSGITRDKLQQEFQEKNSKLQFFVGTRASGEGITLTASPYMVIVDRYWTPGSADQWEGRIDRISQVKNTFVFWLQLPEYISSGDIRVDELIQEKQLGINTQLYGEETTLTFSKITDIITDMTEDLLNEAIKNTESFV